MTSEGFPINPYQYLEEKNIPTKIDSRMFPAPPMPKLFFLSIFRAPVSWLAILISALKVLALCSRWLSSCVLCFGTSCSRLLSRLNLYPYAGS